MAERDAVHPAVVPGDDVDVDVDVDVDDGADEDDDHDDENLRKKADR